MKKILSFLILTLLMIVSSCSKDDNAIEYNIQLPEQGLILGADKNSNLIVKFSTSASWTATVNVDWAILSKTSGDAGEISLPIIAKEENNTGERRTGLLKIKSGDLIKEIEFIQDDKITVNFEEKSFVIPAEGGEVKINYSTNITDVLLQIKLSDNVDWISINENSQGRALSNASVTLNVCANELKNERVATLKFIFINKENNQDIIYTSESLTINQKGIGVGTSINYSYDKEVTNIQSHTIGNGIPLIFMGDGFIDKEIESGYYEEAIRKGIEHFFTEEPIKSLKDYFDIWMVKAVSRNNAFGDSYSTCFSCRLEGGGSTLIEGSHGKVMEYAKAVSGINMDEATCIVILNTEDYAGTCYFGFSDSQSNRILNTAVGYCPMIYGIDNDMFRRVLVHECVGHGFAKLLDEYSYLDMGRIPESEIEDNRRQQRELGWAMNVDFTSDRNSVLWKDFLEDSRYQGSDNYGETLGVYEGACTYWSGAWRPTNESMMRSNINGFNAPSRKAIYTRVMKTGIGDSWNFDLEEFIEFDLSHLPGPASRVSVSEEPSPKMFHAPIFTNMPIK